MAKFFWALVLLVAAVNASTIRGVENTEDEDELIAAVDDKLPVQVLPEQGHRKNSVMPREHINRIVGGIFASKGEFPFFAEWVRPGCGASLIHEDILLSAAHCAGPRGRIRVGSFKQNINNGVHVRRIRRAVIHPNYNDDTLDNDVMVLKIGSKSGKKVIKLNSNPAVPAAGGALTVIGHGAKREDGNGSNRLREVTIPYIPHSTCASLLGSGQLTENVMMCAGLTSGGKDSCQGDSGGPIFEFQNGEPVQVGIVSWGFGCARPNNPGVYTRISGVYDWIQEQICELSSNPPPSCGGPSVPAPAPGGGGDEPDCDEAT